MVDAKRPGPLATVGGALVFAAVWLSHEVGAWGHDLPTVFDWAGHHSSISHELPPLPRDHFTFSPPVPRPELPPLPRDHLRTAPGPLPVPRPLKDSISAGIKAMQQLRDGLNTDKIVYRVACACMNGAISETSNYDEIRQGIYDRIPDDYRPDGRYSLASSIAVNKAAKALVAATSGGGFAVNYYKYCYARR